MKSLEKNPTAQRFFRSRLAVAGLVILILMFLFSFLGGALMPYGQDQVFYRWEHRQQSVAQLQKNSRFRLTLAPGETLTGTQQAQLALAMNRGDRTLEDFVLEPVGQGWRVWRQGGEVAVGSRLVYTPGPDTQTPAYEVLSQLLTGQTQVGAYAVSEGVLLQNQSPVGLLGDYLISGSGLSLEQMDALVRGIRSGAAELILDEDTYSLSYVPQTDSWEAIRLESTQVWDAYAPPSGDHPLGTDKNGMDMLTRLMYGGRVSLVIGFLVVGVAALLGVALGGVAGFFGGWVDSLIMRLVDVFYCIPSTPILIILGAAMDALRIDAQIRLLYLMGVLGLLGWPEIARLVRGQLLSLREQEFMTATQAVGLPAGHRIFRHLMPNVVPQLIVVCTLRLGSTILTEATLSFLGLGVKFPFASWGNLVSDVSNAYVMTQYPFVWIPAGVCLVLAVLGFNFVGDGLRDAFDPKTKG